MYFYWLCRAFYRAKIKSTVRRDYRKTKTTWFLYDLSSAVGFSVMVVVALSATTVEIAPVAGSSSVSWRAVSAAVMRPRHLPPVCYSF